MTDYITVDDLKEHMGDVGHAQEDGIMQVAVTAASRAVDHHCQRRFWKTTTTNEPRVYHADRYDRVRVDDFHTTTGLVIETDPSDNGTWSVTWGTNDYQLYPLNGIRAGLEGWAYSEIRAVNRYQFPTCTRRATVRVTAQWGWTDVPQQVVNATRILSARLVKRASSPEGVIGGFGDFDPIRISSRMDPDVAALLSPFQRLVEA